MPSKAKAKNAPAHQHDKRHENGLAAPGRRVIRQRSNHNLNANGASNGKPIGSTTTPTTPTPTTIITPALLQPSAATTSTGVDYSNECLRPHEISRASSSSLSQATNHAHFKDQLVSTGSEGVLDRDRTNSDVSNEGMGYYNEMVEDVQQEDGSCYPGGHHHHHHHHHHDNSRKHNVTPHPKTTLATISTILTYYPLRDAISILILLLSLPATLVLIIQTLFASLTFVPPTAGISLPNIKDMFNTSNMGYPALATILFVDLLFYVCWIVVWGPVQNLLLDLSQAVIAVSLSGAAASNGGQTYSIVTCSTIVCVVHVLRYRAIHLTALDYLRSVIHKMDLGIDLSVSFPATSFLYNSAPSQHGWLYAGLRTILGIHIVSQGVTTCIRRSLANANERGTHVVPTISRADTEASAGFDLSSSSSASASAAAAAAIRNSTPGTPSTPDLSIQHLPASTYNSDGRSRGSSPGPRGDRTRESNTKKRRKQANEVRSKQPLWAAIASTKVTFVKEMEQRDAIDDAKEAAIMDKAPSQIMTFATASKAAFDRVWISDVHDTEIIMRVELSPASLAKHSSKSADDDNNHNNHNNDNDDLKVVAGIDRTKPFYVRMNGASWSSVRLFEASSQDKSRPQHFTVDIFGLAPLSSYLCEIVDIADHNTLCSLNFITNKTARTAEQTPILPTPVVQHSALRPSSPITTLKKSIEQANANLSDTRNRTKKTKKDQRSAYADIRREINTLKGKVENSGGMDDKQTRRLQQITQHKNQADEASVQFTRQAHDMGELPAEEIAISEEIKQQWQTALDRRSSATRETDAARSNSDRDLRDLASDVTGAETKREKLSTRYLQRREELMAAAARQQADTSARQKHIHDRTVKREEQDKTETQLRFHIASMINDAELWNNKGVDAYQQGQAMSNWPTPPPGYSSPSTPDNQNNGSLQQQQHTNGFSSSYHPQQFPTAYQQQQPLQGAPHPRGRSSSMLSQYSGFTDNGEDTSASFNPRPQLSWPVQKHAFNNGAIVDDGREHEGSSGGSSGTNGSTASSSPRPDVRLYAPTKMSPIGPPRKKTASPQATEFVSPSSPPPPLLPPSTLKNGSR